MQTRDGEVEKKTVGDHSRHFEETPVTDGEPEIDHRDLVRRHLKVLLLHLAARSKNPGADLEDLLHEVIDELHTEVKNTLEARSKLRLVSGP